MCFYDLSIISIALGLDAFSMAFSVGLSNKINRKKALITIVIFGFFQFLFATMGGYLGGYFNMYIFHLSSKLGGVIVLLVGLLMFKEGLSKEDNLKDLNFFIIMILGICVSIDALVIGFTLFCNMSLENLILKSSSIVGIICSFLTATGFLISKKIRRNSFLKEYANLLGGLMLIFFGLKMILF
ncbi:Putative Mn2+ efflux pump MntP [Proteiniborus ethanoligenes]|uniref:Putative Mn2+ efflux pump MntP n=1 Tax=Proteiniborus ethanoligenes TaxID=415015 RepID=A0A1H3NYL6_9FIRM|nr:manganese efflux pump [Proteiniborus ethanoligenes]SDY93982.1 Putative Mn2+ efflux pump MntP [Proteiniborus ethanoligenes]